jgi:hypothetical protein
LSNWTRVRLKGFDSPLFFLEQGVLKFYKGDLAGFAPHRIGARITVGSVVFSQPIKPVTGESLACQLQILNDHLNPFLDHQVCLELKRYGITPPHTASSILRPEWLLSGYGNPDVVHVVAHSLLPLAYDMSEDSSRGSLTVPVPDKTEELVYSCPEENKLDPLEVKFFYSVDLEERVANFATKFALLCGLITAWLERNPVTEHFMPKHWTSLLEKSGPIDTETYPWKLLNSELSRDLTNCAC